MRTVAEIISETEKSKTYKVEVRDRYLEELFNRVRMCEWNAEESLSFFRERIDDLGHEIHGSNNDDDYGEIANNTAQGYGSYAKDKEASFHASRYAEAKKRFDDLDFSLCVLGFQGEYDKWKKENGID